MQSLFSHPHITTTISSQGYQRMRLTHTGAMTSMRTVSSRSPFHVKLWSGKKNKYTFRNLLSHSLFISFLYSSNGRNVKLYNDFLNTESILKPPTVVIVPRNKSSQNFIADARYADFTSALDTPVGYSNAECYIVPPYKPVMYVGLQAEKDSFIDIYLLRGNNQFN